MNIENIEKAQQCAALLVAGLQECLKTCSALEAMLILPEIGNATDIDIKLSHILHAMKNKPF